MERLQRGHGEVMGSNEVTKRPRGVEVMERSQEVTGGYREVTGSHEVNERSRGGHGEITNRSQGGRGKS